jgi:Spy/CpxP family protein refolding chaperone
MKRSAAFSGRMAALTLAFFLSAVMALQAQQGQKNGGGWGNATPEERAKRLTGMMKDQLSLTEKQEPRIAEINLKFAKKNEDARKIADTTERRKALKAINQQRELEYKTVLTATQFKTYQKLAEEMKARRGGPLH